ncbi:MAG: hypothetical protein AB7L76_20960 [Burkholderiaceae bacterium]
MRHERIALLEAAIWREIKDQRAQGIVSFCDGNGRWAALWRELMKAPPLEWPPDAELLTWPKSCMPAPARLPGSAA